jgi:serine protease Do
MIALVLAACVAQGDDSSEALARVLHQLREGVSRSVVAIEADRESDPEGAGGAGAVAAHRDFLNRPKGPCSGVIYEADGHIVTSYFNVSGVIRKEGLQVTLGDGRELPARLLGFDQRRDIALLKVEAEGLPTLPKADLGALAQGAFVALVGRAPDRRSPTLNLGIVSAMSRMAKAAVQTDAEMNYGNTGGALVTLRGELVGVGCNIKPRTNWGQSSGVGFACKVTEIDRLLDRLKKGEKMTAENRPYLGIVPGEGDPEVAGVQVAEVRGGGAAEKAGVKANDVIVEFDGKKVADSESLRELLYEKKIGDEVALKVKRKNDKKEYEDKDLNVKLEGAPEEE